MSSYSKQFENPYPDGWENAPSEETPITADALQSHTDAIEGIDDYLYDNPIPNKNIYKDDAIAINNNTIGKYSFAFGNGVAASGLQAHAEGQNTLASGQSSHAEGDGTRATMSESHAEGWQSQANGKRSHAEGQGTYANANEQHTQGRWNVIDTESKYAHIVGNGTSSARSNAHTLDWDGNAWFSGDVEDGSGNKLSSVASDVSELNSDIVNKVDINYKEYSNLKIEIGALNDDTGVPYSYQKGFRNTDYIVPSLYSILKSSKLISVYKYNTDNSFVGMTQYSANSNIMLMKGFKYKFFVYVGRIIDNISEFENVVTLISDISESGLSYQNLIESIEIIDKPFYTNGYVSDDHRFVSSSKYVCSSPIKNDGCKLVGSNSLVYYIINCNSDGEPISEGEQHTGITYIDKDRCDYFIVFGNIGNVTSVSDFKSNFHIERKQSFQKSKYENKKILYLGDSITWRNVSNVGWCGYFNSIVNAGHTENVAVGGASWCDNDNTVQTINPTTSDDDNNVISNQVYSVINKKTTDVNFADFDVIIIACGTNDTKSANISDEIIEQQFYNNGSKVDISDVDKTTWSGAIRYAVDTLRNLYPNSVIFLCSPIQRSGNSYNTIKEKGYLIERMARRLSVQFMDTEKCGIYGMNEITNENGVFLIDGLHPNVKGAKKIAEYNSKEFVKYFVN